MCAIDARWAASKQAGRQAGRQASKQVEEVTSFCQRGSDDEGYWRRSGPISWAPLAWRLAPAVEGWQARLSARRGDVGERSNSGDKKRITTQEHKLLVGRLRSS